MTFYWKFGTTLNFFTNLVPFGEELQKVVTQTVVGVGVGLGSLYFEYSPENIVYIVSFGVECKYTLYYLII